MAMVKIKINCECCGNEFEHRKQCCNSSAAADYKEWALENIKICPKCWRTAEERREMMEYESVIRSAGVNLPELVGTEKQIAWAEKIRIKSVAGMIANINPDKISGLVMRISTHTDAKWWIDNRETVVYTRNMMDLLYADTKFQLVNRDDKTIVYGEFVGFKKLQERLHDFIKSNSLDMATLEILEVPENET